MRSIAAAVILASFPAHAETSFRGLTLGMSSPEIEERLNPQFEANEPAGFPNLLVIQTISVPQKECGTVTLQSGRAFNLVFYPCYFDLPDTVKQEIFAEQAGRAYGIEFRRTNRRSGRGVIFEARTEFETLTIGHGGYYPPTAYLAVNQIPQGNF